MLAYVIFFTSSIFVSYYDFFFHRKISNFLIRSILILPFTFIENLYRLSARDATYGAKMGKADFGITYLQQLVKGKTKDGKKIVIIYLQLF